MTIPSKEDFEEFNDLINQEPFSGYEHIGLNEQLIDDCDALASTIFDGYQMHIAQVLSSKAYQWLAADVSWRAFSIKFFLPPACQRVTKDKFIKAVGTRFHFAARLCNEDEYNRLINFKQKQRSRRRQKMLSRGYSEIEIKEELDSSSWYKLESKDEINSESSRLSNLRREVERSFSIMRHLPVTPRQEMPAIEIDFSILSHIGEYFYEENFLGEPDQRLLQNEQEKISVLKRGSQAIEDLLPALQHNLRFYEEIGDYGEIAAERYRKMIVWLTDIKLSGGFSTKGYEPCDDLLPQPIGRKDDKANRRMLAYNLWRTLCRQAQARHADALVELLSIEGIGAPDKRSVERWVKKWDEEREYLMSIDDD